LGSTIIAAPFAARGRFRPLAFEQLNCAALAEGEAAGRFFRIRTAKTERHRSSAGVLLNRRYAWRGYRSSFSSDPSDDSEQLTLLAVRDGETIGTITVGFDGDSGLCVDDLFPEEVSALRRDGASVCEFTKLAVETTACSKQVLASLFHVAYICAHRLKGYDSLLIEVNPRHVRFYNRMLGFRAASAPRLNRRVDAPAVLMCVDFSHVRTQIEAFGGDPDSDAAERSLYPYAFSAKEEAGIVTRLANAEFLSGPMREPLPALSAA
jgi:hypothetical protein